MQIVFQELSDTITAGFAKHHGASGGKDSLPRMHVASQEGVRHLTIVECEILQGFPADYTKVDYLGRTADFCPSAPRYKAVGNSMAVAVMKWIGCSIASHE